MSHLKKTQNTQRLAGDCSSRSITRERLEADIGVSVSLEFSLSSPIISFLTAENLTLYSLM